MNQRVVEAINRQINSELSASYSYLAMSVWCERQKFVGAARWLRLQSQEEYMHAMKLLDFMLARDCNVELRTIDEAKAIPRPHGIEKFYLEEAVERKAAEQPLLWEARGEADARSWSAKAASLAVSAGVATTTVAAQQELVAGARDRYERTARALGGYTRRAPGEKVPYYLRWALILGGDVAGVAGAAILLGETVPLGVLQAATFGLAVVAGNWAVPLLERQGASSAAAGIAAGLILFAGIVTRPGTRGWVSMSARSSHASRAEIRSRGSATQRVGSQ